MEADWEIDLGAESPAIDAHWSGRVDLAASPDLASQLPEAAQLPGLGNALAQLNASGSPVWTCKSDVWDADPVDADELDAAGEAANCFQACYVDLIPHCPTEWSTPEATANWAKDICRRLHSIALRSCRVDMVIRLAILNGSSEALGITAYGVACGATDSEARSTLSAVVAALANAISPRALRPSASSQLQ